MRGSCLIAVGGRSPIRLAIVDTSGTDGRGLGQSAGEWGLRLN